MKPWIKKTLMGIFGVSIAVGGLTACSSGHHQRGPMTAEKMAEVRGKMVDRVSSKLDLNEAQKTKLNALADQRRVAAQMALLAQMHKQIGKVRLYAIEDQRAGCELIAQRGDEITRHIAPVDGQRQRLGADHGVAAALGVDAGSGMAPGSGIAKASGAVGVPSDSSNS